jgi:hypothetical protein
LDYVEERNAMIRDCTLFSYGFVQANPGSIEISVAELESTESSGQGGTMNATALYFILGDDARDRQYRVILYFNTAGLPDKAAVTAAALKIKRQAIMGTDPFTDHQNIQVDIKKGAFSNITALQLGDFKVAASRANVAAFKNIPLAGNWYRASLMASAFPYINLAGVTQFRLRFKLDDNDDMSADYLRFFGGNYTANPTYRPVLIISYYIFP